MRERIQINNSPISEQLFAKYFFEVWDRLSATGESKPAYFRFLTLVAFHTFIKEQVDTAVIECGIGGEYDSTNLLVSPTVTAVTALGIDHVGMLGDTIEQIAWHKAGIFKRGALAFTVPQPEAAMRVLRERAAANSVNLQETTKNPQIASGQVKLGLAGDFQQSNASLAVAVAKAHLQITNHELPLEFIRGLKLVKWPGRCDMRHDGKVCWCLDGGHTLESIEVAGQWFAEQAKSQNAKRVLIFNQQHRDASTLAAALFKTLSTAIGPKPFTHAIFTTNVTFKESGYKPDLVSAKTNSDDIKSLTVQNTLAKEYAKLDKDAKTMVSASIEEAVELVRHIGSDSDVLCFVTGSLHLVGGALEVLESTGIKAV